MERLIFKEKQLNDRNNYGWIDKNKAGSNDANKAGSNHISKRMRFGTGMAILLICAMLLTACGTGSTAGTDSQGAAGNRPSASGDLQTSGPGGSGAASTSATAITVTDDMIKYGDDDSNSDWKTQNPNYIKLQGSGASLTGSGTTADGNVITISSSGVYVLSGKLDDGQIIVDSKTDGVVRLVLNGAEIHCSDSSAIYVKNADKVVVSLEDGTQNSVSDTDNYVYPDEQTDEPNAAIFSKDDLTINGTGTLTVKGNANNGIVSKDKLRIMSGTIAIKAVDDGIIGKDKVLVRDGTITIEAEGDAVKSTNDTDSTKGFIALQGGTWTIKSGAKGFRAETALLITGGTYSIDASDDALHANNSVTVSGGNLAIASGDDGIHADTAILIKGGDINITKSYEGIESSHITVAGGTITLVSNDDGFNASGGNDSSSQNSMNPQNPWDGGPGMDRFTSNIGVLEINGGNISVDAQGDGLDSNGSIIMTGGTMVVNGPTENMNGALDYNASFEMNGGLLIAAGSSGMAEAADSGSQNSILMYYSNVQQAGTLIHLEDSNGNTIATFAPSKQYQSVVISSPSLKKGSEYVLYTGGTANGTTANGLFTDGTYQGGTKVVSFTISDTVTYLNESGVTTNQSMIPGGRGFGGGPGGFGKGGPRR